MAKELKLRPLHDRVIVKRLAEEQKTAGGIIIPDTAQEKPTEGEVVAVGKGSINREGQHVPMEVKVGDRVLFGKWGANEVKVEGEEYLVMKEDEIIAVVGA
mgnify:CR=1 FL=1